MSLVSTSNSDTAPKRGGKHAPDVAPYLLERDITRISNIGRTTFRNYERKGIVSPSATNDSEYYKYYALDDLQTISLAEAMRKAGMQNKEIAEVLQRGEEATILTAYEQSAEEIRQARRRLKAIVHADRKLGDYRAVKDFTDCWYLRYLPRRWMALLPVQGNELRMIPHPLNIHSYGKLTGVIDVVGWAETASFGQLHSINVKDKCDTHFINIELSTPPMPGVTGSNIVDGGCYFRAPFDGVTATSYPCNTSRCLECARYGAEPINDNGLKIHELKEWAQAAKDESRWNTTLTIDDFCCLKPEKQVPLWTNYIAENHPELPVESQDMNPQQMSSCIRPAMMPHEVKLPLGVTACMLPAGVYLCRKFKSNEWDTALEVVDNRLSSITQQTSISQDELARANRLIHTMDMVQTSGPFVEPFASPRSEEDPAIAGWYRKISDSDFKHLRLPVDAALTSETGYCIVAANEPLPIRRKEVRMEFQVLVNAEPFLPPLG